MCLSHICVNGMFMNKVIWCKNEFGEYGHEQAGDSTHTGNEDL